MQIRILGAAAGGGLPQWNCRCANCEAARNGSPDVAARTQSSVAVSGDGHAWFLLNASADVRQQLVSISDLWPPAPAKRGTPIAGCVLTDAEIDHTSGLLQLREGVTLGIFSTAIVRCWLDEHLGVASVLSAFAERPWTELPLNEPIELPLQDGSVSGLALRAFETGRDVPRFASENPADAVGSIVGLEIHDAGSGGRLVYAPGVASIDSALVDAATRADAILIDGTFWSDDEPQRMGITDRTSHEMGHVPVGGDEGSLTWLAGLSARHRVYIHMNNTNPMLDSRSDEHRAVSAAGVRVGVDGDAFEL